MAVFTISRLDERINALKEQLAALDVDYAREKAALAARLAKLQGVRAQITPEMLTLLTQLNAALDS